MTHTAVAGFIWVSDVSGHGLGCVLCLVQTDRDTDKHFVSFPPLCQQKAVYLHLQIFVCTAGKNKQSVWERTVQLQAGHTHTSTAS